MIGDTGSDRVLDALCGGFQPWGGPAERLKESLGSLVACLVGIWSPPIGLLPGHLLQAGESHLGLRSRLATLGNDRHVVSSFDRVRSCHPPGGRGKQTGGLPSSFPVTRVLSQLTSTPSVICVSTPIVSISAPRTSALRTP